MCAVSYIGDQWSRTAQQTYPFIQYWPSTDQISREEFNALKNEMQELRKLLLAAKDFDAATGQPECEDEDKIALLKRVAEMVGVDLEEVFAS